MISARLLRIAAPALAPSIAKLINLSLSTGKFLQRWKSAKVLPLFKGGDAHEPSNYRPISVLPFLSKIIERHLHDSLYAYLVDNNLIYSRQSGFRKRCSTETALIKIIDDLFFNLDKDLVTGMLLVDYRKAFDMVDHELLLKKLAVYGIQNQELKWCRSYLSARMQAVYLDGKQSSETLVQHGVPQGSILGPLLFIIFINDLPLYVSSKIDLYADDTTAMASADFRNILELENSLNKSAREIHQWASSNKLPLNEDKTKVLMITGKRLASKISYYPNITLDADTPLSTVESATLLGLDLDCKLSFSNHIEKLCKNISSRIAVLRKIRGFVPLRQRIQYYNSVIRPIMSYGSVIWSNCDKELLNRVFKLQKRAARVILYADRLAPSVELFNKLSWIPFYEQCKIDKCSILYKRVNGYLPGYLNDHILINSNVHSRSTRYANVNAICPKYKRETEGGKTFTVSSIKLWNKLPIDIRKADSVTLFKKIMWRNIFKDQQLLHHFNI